jgi:hypothetical protein
MKKGLILSLSAVMALSFVASCGGTPASSSAAAASSEEAASSEAASSSAPHAELPIDVGNIDGIREAYGAVDGNLVAKVELQVGKGKIASAHINETYSPEAFAEIDPAEVTGVTPDTVTVNYVTRKVAADHTFAKYIKVGDQVFTGSARTDADTYGNHMLYANDKVADLFAYIASGSAEAGWYYNAIENGYFQVVKDATGAAFDTEYTLGAIKTNKAAFKADANSTYWPKSSYAAYGWKNNISMIQDSLVGLDLHTMPTVAKDDTTGFWSIGGVVSGATISSFEAYVKLAYQAYNGEGETATFYGLSDGGTLVGKVELAVDAKTHTIMNAYIDEGFLPSTIASINPTEISTLTLTEGTDYFDKAAVVYGRTVTYHFAKYLVVNGITFTGTLRDEAYHGEWMKYSSEANKIDDLYDYINGSSAAAQWYFNSLKEHKAEVDTYDATGKKYVSTGLTMGTSGKGTFFKADRKNTYWPEDAANEVLGWKGNIAKLEAALVGLDLYNVDDTDGSGVPVSPTASQQTTDKTAKDYNHWYINIKSQGVSIDSGATIETFAEYINSVYFAYCSIVNTTLAAA